MLCVQPRMYVYLPNDLCVPKNEFDLYFAVLKTTRMDILRVLLQIAWNPRNHTVSPADLTYLRHWRYLDGQNQIPPTVQEILKSCFDLKYCCWNAKGIRVEVIYPEILQPVLPAKESVSVPSSPDLGSQTSESPCIDDPKNKKLGTSTPVKVSSPKEIALDAEQERELPSPLDLRAKEEPVPPAPPKHSPPPTPKDLYGIVNKISGNNSVLQEVIEKGGLSWRVVYDPKSYYFYGHRFKEGALSELLCQRALDNSDTELMEAILPFLTQEEIERRIEANHPSTFLRTKEGVKLLESYNCARDYLVRECFPEGQCYGSKSLAQIESVRNVLSSSEITALEQNRIPTSLLNDLFILRMKHPYYMNWCLKVLKSRARQFLKAPILIQELLKTPPSKERSRLALYVTVCLNFYDPSLNEAAFRFQEPSSSSKNYCVSMDNEIGRYLEREGLAGRYENIRLIRDNFAFLLVNKEGLSFFNIFLDSTHIRKTNQEYKDMIDSLEIRKEVEPIYTVRQQTRPTWNRSWRRG